MKLRDMPIRRKLILIILSTSATAMVLLLGSFIAYEYITFRKATVRQLTTIGEIAAANSTAALAFQDQNDAKEILAALAAEKHIVAACLYDKDGKLFSKYPEGVPDASLPAAPGPDGYVFGSSFLEGFQPVAQGENVRLGTLYLKFDTGTVISEWMSLTLEIGAAVMGIVLLVAYLISRALQQQISRPILALAETARTVSERRDYSVRAKKLGGDELGLLTDAFNHMLTEIHQLHRELEERVKNRTAQLEDANRELEAFSYSVSHDLRAPLRHIDGFAGLLAKHASGTLDDQGRRYISTISGAAKQMGRLIDDLLEFSRTGRKELNKSDVDQEALVADVIREGRFSQAIEWKVGPLPRVDADQAMLRQVWSNLLENAVKYSGNAERPRVEIGSMPDPATGELVFFVRDNGVGFDMQYVDKLFGVFQRLHALSEFQGTGIGLANVRRIVIRHGGRVWAEGSVGKGATFFFSMPRPRSIPAKT
jgi:signal transduction histidine kinase